MNETNKYDYTYSPKDKIEVQKIRDKYCSKSDNKLEQLRQMDAGAARKGTLTSLIVGIIGCLIFGTGMSCTMLWNENLFLIGLFTGIIGLICIIAAYPLYICITRKERKRIAPEILRLSDELLK
jgi:uncharacterized membrane protein YeaQ/YmgE (transglycosylase-associated protein family)